MAKQKKDQQLPDTQPAPDHQGGGNAPPVITVDYDLYAEYLEDSGLSEEQKQEFLQALWTIIVGFVDLGFGVHPIQQACGQHQDSSLKAPTTGPDEIYLTQRSIIEEFVKSADLETDPAEEGVET